MASQTDPTWPPATTGQGGQGCGRSGEPPDDRPAWLTQGTTILEPAPQSAGGHDRPGPADQSPADSGRPWEQNPHTWGEPVGPPAWQGQAGGSAWERPAGGPAWRDPAGGPGWGDAATTEPTVPLGRSAPPWGAPAPEQPHESRPRGLHRFRRGLALAAAGVILVAAGYAASGLTEPEAPAEQATGAGVPPAQGGPGPVQQSNAPEPVAAVAEALIPSVVRLETGSGIGSGVIYDPGGYILTAAHVVEGASTVSVRMADGNSFQGEVLGADTATDIGVVKVEATGLPAATLATGVDLQVGQMAVAIGSPFGLQDTVTAGIVSGLDRSLQVEGGGSRTVLQTDAPINPGNSGGALADRQGRVIGINSAIRPGAGSVGNIGVGFAVPIDTAARVAGAIVQGQPVETAFIGISGVDSPVAAGALVQEIQPGSPAEAAGLQVGDLVTGFDGEAIGGIDDLVAKTRASSVGQTVTLTIVRDGQEQKVDVTLGAKP